MTNGTVRTARQVWRDGGGFRGVCRLGRRLTRKPLRTLPPLNSYCSEASRSGGHETGPGNPESLPPREKQAAGGVSRPAAQGLRQPRWRPSPWRRVTFGEDFPVPDTGRLPRITPLHCPSRGRLMFPLCGRRTRGTRSSHNLPEVPQFPLPAAPPSFRASRTPHLRGSRPRGNKSHPQTRTLRPLSAPLK